MVAGPPYLFDGSADQVTVRGEFDAELTVVTIRGQWDRALWRLVARVLRKCLSEHPRGLIIDLTALDDPAALSVPTWLNAHRGGEAMDPSVPVVLVIAADVALARRLLRAGIDRRLAMHADLEHAREALVSRLPLTRRMEMRIEPETRTPALARRLIRDACDAWRLPGIEFPAQLVVSELVSNVVEHTRDAGRLLVAQRTGGLHIAVADRDPALPAMPTRMPVQRSDPLAEGGRGLRIVHRLAAAWGAMPIDGGKVVWATLREARSG